MKRFHKMAYFKKGYLGNIVTNSSMRRVLAAAVDGGFIHSDVCGELFFFRVFHLTDWCPGSRHDNHRSGAHVAAGLLVRGGRSLELSPGDVDPVRPVSALQHELLIQ